MAPKYIRLETDGRMGILTLDRPEKRNALTSQMLEDLEQLLRQADRDDDIDVVILTGAGSAFCAGLDLNELSDSGANMRASDPDGQIGPIPVMSKPLIAAVNGAAVTGGFEIAMLCDIILASETATFGDTHARVGLLPDWGMSAFLPHLIGVKKATEMFLTGNFIGAVEAHQLGLVNHVVTPSELLKRAKELARDIISNDQRAVRELLRLQRQISRVNVGEGLRVEAERAAAWQGAGIDGEMIKDRREGLMERNRERGAS